MQKRNDSLSRSGLVQQDAASDDDNILCSIQTSSPPRMSLDVRPEIYMRPTTAIIGIGLASSCFLLAGAGFFVMGALLDYVFGGLFRMFMYHDKHPLQYIAIVSVVFGIVGTFWLRVFGHTTGWKQWTSMFVTIVITIIVASVPGGVLWKIHDMQAGYFPQGSRLWDDLLWGAREGLMVGWLVVVVSVPYNLLGLVVGMLVLHRLPSLAARIEN